MNRIGNFITLPLSAIALSATLAACSRTDVALSATAPVALAASAAEAAPRAMPNDALPRMLVTKSPTCGCCVAWIEHMRHAGFEVDVRDTEDVHAVKERLGVPFGKGSCHTAQVAGYFVEGHVPAGDVKRLLVERPDAKGLTVPGMPMGSPGMEIPDGRIQPYVVELVAKDGSTSAFAIHGR